MRLLIVALGLVFTHSAFASDECKSVWVYKPFKTCATDANGLDLSKPGEATTFNLKSGWLSGGRDQGKVCQDVASAFNDLNRSKGLHATLKIPTPVGEESENHIVQQEYRYACELEVRKFDFKTAPNPVCGVEDKFSYQVGGSAANLVGQDLNCLSCENLNDKAPELMVKCLHDSIANIIEPRAIELRDSDLSAVSAQVKRLLDLSRQVQVPGLTTTDELSFFTNYLNKHPAQNEPQGGGWGGRGTAPTLQ